MAQHNRRWLSDRLDWTGDDWSGGFTTTVKVKWLWADPDGKPVEDYGQSRGDDTPMIEETARAVIAAAQKACEPYEKSWVDIDKALDDLYDEINKKHI